MGVEPATAKKEGIKMNYIYYIYIYIDDSLSPSLSDSDPKRKTEGVTNLRWALVHTHWELRMSYVHICHIRVDGRNNNSSAHAITSMRIRKSEIQ